MTIWLAPFVTESGALLPLLRPYPVEGMTRYPVSTAVNSSCNKELETIAPAAVF